MADAPFYSFILLLLLVRHYLSFQIQQAPPWKKMRAFLPVCHRAAMEQSTTNNRLCSFISSCLMDPIETQTRARGVGDRAANSVSLLMTHKSKLGSIGPFWENFDAGRFGFRRQRPISSNVRYSRLPHSRVHTFDLETHTHTHTHSDCILE